jgi:4-amino-4-deoxy-L-arabinose transferase-like glycosyltransferase
MRATFILSTIKKLNPYLLLFILCLVLYLPASFIRAPIPPDEVRSISISQNIDTLEEFIRPTHLNQPYYDKPPLYFWILNLLLKLSSFNLLFLPTLFHVVVSWGILSLNYLFFKKEGVPKIGLYSSFLLATTVIFFGMSFILRMDILFLFFNFLAVFCFWTAIKEKKSKYLVGALVCSFLAVFTKGALGIVFPFFIEVMIGIFLKDRKAIVKAVLINSCVILMTAIWIFSFNRIDPQYFSKMVGEQTFARGFGGEEHSSLRIRPFLYYLPFIFLLLLPWSFLGSGYFINFKKSKKHFWEKVYLAWFLGGFLILSIIHSKMYMYLLILSIPFCGLTAKFLRDAGEGIKRKLMYITTGFFVFIWMGGIIYSLVGKEDVPIFLVISIVIMFLGGLIFMIKKPFPVQLRSFFFIWVLLLQVINLGVLPKIAAHSELKQIADALVTLEVKYDKIYVKDILQLQLPAYQGIRKPVIFRDEKSCPAGPVLFIGTYPRDENPSCYKKILQIGENRFLYRER